MFGRVRSYDRLAGLGIEEMDAVEAGIEGNRIAARQGQALRRDGANFLAAKIGIDVEIGTGRLGDIDDGLDADRARRHVLGPHAIDDLAALARVCGPAARAGSRPIAMRTLLPSISPFSRFIDGEPMNSATKRLAG